MNAESMLIQAEMDIHRARAALYDENEGEFRTAVLQLEAKARELAQLVTTW